jgi:hypothetical protein
VSTGDRLGRLRARLAAAALCFALICCLSYAGQRLWDARTEPAIGTVSLQATIPYYWRLAITALHGLGAAALAYWGLPESAAERLLRVTPWLVPLVVLPAVIAMLMVP